MQATCDYGRVPESSTESTTQTPPQPSGGGGSRRGRQTMRDMLLSMLVLGVIVLVLAGVVHSCSFSPGGPSVNTSDLPSVDVSAELGAEAGQFPFPLREPALPASWRPSSASQQPVGAAGTDTVVDIGWVSTAGHYVELAQSNGAVPDLVSQIVGDDSGTPIVSQGTVPVAGHTWTIYPGVREEQTWVLDLGAVRLLITGNGTKAEFTTMATAAEAAPIVKPTPN
jgi:hypothetical protein